MVLGDIPSASGSISGERLPSSTDGGSTFEYVGAKEGILVVLAV